MEEDELRVETLSFDELDSSLQDDVIAHFQSDDYLVEDDWYQWLWDDFVINQEQEGINIDSNSLSFDFHYGTNLEYNGDINSGDKVFTDMQSESLKDFIAKEWVYDISESFSGKELDEEYDFNRDVIHEEIEEEFFPDALVESEKVIIPIHTELDILKTAKSYDVENYEFIKKLLEAITAAGLFFQETVEMDETEYIDFIDEVTNDIESSIESDVEEYRESVDMKLEEIYDNFSSDLENTYEYYFTEEYARENLANKTFEVTFDEDGNQDYIDDLNGE